MRLSEKKLNKRIVRSQTTMQLFAIELVSNAFQYLVPDNTDRSFTNFIAEHLSPEDQWEVAIWERSYRSRYQSNTEENFMFFNEKLLTSSEIYHLDHGLHLCFTILLESSTMPFKKTKSQRTSCLR